MKCLYHANCNDGAGAALAVFKLYGDRGHEYIPCHYGSPIPDDLDGDDVIMVDFSIKKEEVRKLAKIANSILIIDHHKTAQDDLEDVDDEQGCPIKIVFDMNKSGAVLTWEYFHPWKEVPPLFEHIQDRDLWEFRLEGTAAITKALMLYPDWREWLDLKVTDLFKQGHAINSFLSLQAEKIIECPPTKFEYTGDKVPVYNLPGFMISDTLHMALKKYPDAPFAVAYFDLPDRRVYSLRSRAGFETDVSEIAKHLGGGGHKNAAGFVVEKKEKHTAELMV